MLAQLTLLGMKLSDARRRRDLQPTGHFLFLFKNNGRASSLAHWLVKTERVGSHHCWRDRHAENWSRCRTSCIWRCQRGCSVRLACDGRACSRRSLRSAPLAEREMCGRLCDVQFKLDASGSYIIENQVQTWHLHSRALLTQLIRDVPERFLEVLDLSTRRGMRPELVRSRVHGSLEKV